MTQTIISAEEFRAEAVRRFGENSMNWRFKCPSCGHVASVQDYQTAGAEAAHVGFSCIGRFLEHYQEAFTGGPGPCNYAGGGLIGINPVAVQAENGKVIQMFELADAE